MSSDKLSALESHQSRIDAEIALLSKRVAQAQVEVSSNSSSDSSALLAQYEDKVRYTIPIAICAFLLYEPALPKSNFWQ